METSASPAHPVVKKIYYCTGCHRRIIVAAPCIDSLTKAGWESSIGSNEATCPTCIKGKDL